MLKNRMLSVLLIVLGIISVFIECDITFLVFTLLIGIPTFFSKDKSTY